MCSCDRSQGKELITRLQACIYALCSLRNTSFISFILKRVVFDVQQGQKRDPLTAIRSLGPSITNGNGLPPPRPRESTFRQANRVTPSQPREATMISAPFVDRSHFPSTDHTSRLLDDDRFFLITSFMTRQTASLPHAHDVHGVKVGLTWYTCKASCLCSIRSTGFLFLF